MPKYNIIIPADMNPHPKSYEESAAAILANYFKSNAYFIKKPAIPRLIFVFEISNGN